MPPNSEPPIQSAQAASSSNRLQTIARLSPMGKKLFKFIEFDENETLLLEVRKHPVGLFWISVLGFVVSFIVLLATVFFAQAIGNGALDGSGANASSARGIVILIGLIVSVLGIIITVVIGMLYVRDVIFITNEKIAEVVYISLFNRQTIQLGMGKVEDVKVSQIGIFPRIFNYGSLLIETAGETKNPEFPYVPDPYMVSQVIIQAHEQYVQKYGN